LKAEGGLSEDLCLSKDPDLNTVKPIHVHTYAEDGNSLPDDYDDFLKRYGELRDKRIAKQCIEDTFVDVDPVTQCAFESFYD